MKNILIIGATSAISKAFAERVSTIDNKLFFVARDNKKINALKNDLVIRHSAKIETFILDVNNIDKISEMYSAAKFFLGNIDTILISYGTLPNQTECENDIEFAVSEFKTNTIGTIGLCLKAGNVLQEQKSGTLVVITSVAGDRGRQSNYLYGSAKGAVNIFLQGLRNRLTKFGVKVLTVKPGFVDTPMTAHLPQNPLFSSPELIAKGIVKAINKKKSREIYLPGYWRIIMFIIKAVPGKIFNKLSL